jgi:hypothetical protein
MPATSAFWGGGGWSGAAGCWTTGGLDGGMIFVLQLARTKSRMKWDADRRPRLAVSPVRLLDDSPHATAEA